MKKRKIGLLLMICCMILVTGCAREGVEDDRTPVPELPPAEARYAAPDGDGIIARGGEYRVYYPARQGSYLVSRSVVLEGADLHETAERLVRSMLAFEGDNEAKRIGGTRQLDLYGAHPIEISVGVCTVNLSRAALQLNAEEYYWNCLALSTTLCELSEINSVNVLVEDKSRALDTKGLLPLGTLITQPGENVPVLWERMQARKTPLNENGSQTPLNAWATLYYPLPDNRGIACTVRNINFEGQTPGQLALGLISEVSNVRRNMIGGQDFPELRSLLIAEQLVVSERDDGTWMITLPLREDAEALLETGKTDLSCFMAAMTYTLTTFIPDITAVCFRAGNKLITELKSERFEPVTALGGMVTRNAVEAYLTSSTTVYFARNGILCECERPIARRSADSPRAQLCALIEGPDRSEQEDGISATLPDTIREDDILGIAAEGDTLLVNLSERFRTQIQEQGPEAETMICYSMVNTLCKNTGMKRIRFFFEGEQTEYVAGIVYWAGEFMYNIGLAEKGLG